MVKKSSFTETTQTAAKEAECHFMSKKIWSPLHLHRMRVLVGSSDDASWNILMTGTSKIFVFSKIKNSSHTTLE